MGLFDKFKKEDNFQYNDSKNRATFTCRHVMSKQSPIEYGSRSSF